MTRRARNTFGLLVFVMGATARPATSCCGEWRPPEVAGLMVRAEAGGAALSWDVAPDGECTTYAVLASESLPVTDELVAGLDAPAHLDATPLAVGPIRYYLVRARNACGSGTYGLLRASLDAASPCP